MVCTLDHQIQVLPLTFSLRCSPEFKKDVVPAVRLVDRDGVQPVPLSRRLDHLRLRMVERGNGVRELRRKMVPDAAE
jgi:hypothetical protein